MNQPYFRIIATVPCEEMTIELKSRNYLCVMQSTSEALDTSILKVRTTAAHTMRALGEIRLTACTLN